MNICRTKTYESTDETKVLIIKNWLGMVGLQLIKMFTNEDKEKCKNVTGIIFYMKARSSSHAIIG